MKRKGFTLIELIVVIAIIGILATIILVAVSNQTPKAQQTAAVENLNRALSAAEICVAAGGNLNTLTASKQPTGAICADTSTTNAVWPGVLAGSYDYWVTATTGAVTAIGADATPAFGEEIGTGLKIKCKVTGCTKS